MKLIVPAFTTSVRIAITLTFLSISSNFIITQPAHAFTLEELSHFFGAMHNYTKHIQEDIVVPSQRRNQPAAPTNIPDESFPVSPEPPTQEDIQFPETPE
jgi:hypothetical protein